MKRRMTGVIVGLGLLALPATSLGGGVAPTSPAQPRAGLGAVVAKDSAKKNPAAAVARVTLTDFGKVSYRISSAPNDLKVDWGITTRCVKGSLIDYFPGPGDFKTNTRPGGFGGTFPVPLANPDYCTFAVAGQIFKYDVGKRVTVKIFDAG